jgi:8-oxo-dGTP diphosphatase
LRRCAGGIPLKQDQILLGKRASDRDLYPNTWDIIGGHCLPGEELEQTLVRELQEEIAVTPTAFSKLAVLHEPQPHIYGEREYHVYVITAWIGPGPTALGEEHSEVRWFPIDEALQLDLAHPKYADLLRTIQGSTFSCFGKALP